MDTVTAPTWLLLVVVAAYLVVRLAEAAVDAYRTRRGLPTGGHCGHCAQVEELAGDLDAARSLIETGWQRVRDVEPLRDELAEACTTARDHLAVLAAIRADVEQRSPAPPHGRAS